MAARSLILLALVAVGLVALVVASRREVSPPRRRR